MKFANLDDEGDCVRGWFVNHPKLRDHSEVPDYLYDNPYITQGFRYLTNYWDAFKSLFYFHNCFMDTWTSVVTGLQSIALLVASASIPTDQWKHGASDRTCLVLFFFMGIFHAPCSVLYHLFGHAGISKECYLFFQRLDFFMIFFGMSFLSLSLAWYPWQAYPAAIAILGVLSTGFSMVILYRIKMDISPIGRIQAIAVQVFIAMAPVFYQIFHDIVRGELTNGTLWWGLGIFASLLFGAITYGGKIPDRCYPNPLFNGHAWMHVGVNGAVFCEYMFIRAAFHQYEHTHT